MGCCYSSPSRSSPYATDSAPHPPADSSRANITAHPSLRSHNSVSSPPRLSGSRAVSSFGGSARLSQTPNAPLKAPTSWKSSDVKGRQSERWLSREGDNRCTRSGIRREREEFFDTRVTGRPEIWQALQLVADMVRQGDLPGAQGVLDASGCTCPTGELTKGVYDEIGNLYHLPVWVVSDPMDVVEDEGGQPQGGAMADEVDKEGKEGNGMVETDEEDETSAAEKRDEKGKGRMVDALRVKCRLSDRGTDVTVSVGREQSVRVLVRKIQDAAGTVGKNKVKIGYLGKMLNENESLLAQGWREGHVVNAFLFA